MTFKILRPVMIFTETSSQVAVFTKRTSPVLFGFMKTSMRFLIGQFKVFQSVIKAISVYVMYNFSRFKKPAKMFFHNKSMFSNITNVISKGVILLTNKPISRAIGNTIFPIRGFVAIRNMFKKTLTAKPTITFSFKFSDIIKVTDYATTRANNRIIHWHSLSWSNL